MFYTNKVLFVHIPRTGGTWLTKWAHDTFDASVDVHHCKHATLEQLYMLIPDLEALTPFTIVRESSDVLWSYYDMAIHEEDYSLCTKQWEEETNRLRAMTFEEYLHGGDHVLSHPYYERPIKEFAYEKPHRAVCEWLLEVHGVGHDALRTMPRPWLV